MEQQVKIIGRGTWLDKVAFEVVDREKHLGRNLSLIRVESGLAASGLPHIGSVGDAIRSYGVKLALESAGYSSELIAFSDDLDGLRKVPSGFPDSLNQYIAHPVSEIPDPFGCHASYADHTSSLLRDSLDRLGISYRFMSGTEVYRSGILNEQIVKILSNADKIGKQIAGMVGQTKYESRLPYTPICGNCGRLYVTAAHKFDPEKRTVFYNCEGTELRGSHLEGCGHAGTVTIEEAKGKLVWKGEFAARWAALDVRFEAYGKEIADSVKINDWISENILGFPAPYHVRYELFQDKSGKKMSKSEGNLVTPQEWLEYGSAESLRLLMFKRILGARSISIEDIPTYMDEFDDLEDYYFSTRKDENPLRRAKLRGLYEYSVLLKVPDHKREHVPYRLLVELSAAAPPGKLEEYVEKRLISYGIIRRTSEEVRRRILLAAKWAARQDATVRTSRTTVKVDEKMRKALQDFVELAKGRSSADEIQAAAFDAIRNHGIDTKKFFSTIYSILFGVERGPRLGQYVVDAGAEYVAHKLLQSTATNEK
jgi:lysyl-tRNA synthetase class 1